MFPGIIWNGWKWREMASNRWTWLKRLEKRMEMDVNGWNNWKRLEMDGNG